LDVFGEFLMKNLRDAALRSADCLLNGGAKAPSLARLQRDLAGMSEAQKDIVRRLVLEVVDSGTHDFLFALQEAHDLGGRDDPPR
jgi:hypothetical protein